MRTHRFRLDRLLRTLRVPLVAILSSFVWVIAVPASGGTGPDVIILALSDIGNFGQLGMIRAYSVGTTACNVGTAPLFWCNSIGGCGGGSTGSDHPVIAQNIYRLKNGRMQQLGMSWLKHGFTSTNSPDPSCGSCTTPPLGADQLGVGCKDTYNSSLNGSRPLGMRSEVNAATGIFPFPYSSSAVITLLDQRVQVAEADLDPALNPGARYFAEGQYVTRDDAAAENGLNNASYNEISVSAGTFNLSFVGPTVRERSAPHAWKTLDPFVEMVNADLGSTPVERFEIARRISNPSPGLWHYEYIIRNMNSDRAAQSLTLDFGAATNISGAGMFSANHHSGEPYSVLPWTAVVDVNSVRWETAPFGTDPNANALRWGTAFSFWFDADRSPSSLTHTLTLFKPGTPTEIMFAFPTIDIFNDGFESGDTSAWTTQVP